MTKTGGFGVKIQPGDMWVTLPDAPRYEFAKVKRVTTLHVYYEDRTRLYPARMDRKVFRKYFKKYRNE